MGFLTVNGMLLTYDQYKGKTKCYNALGMKQFSDLHKTFKDRQLKQAELHWGEEIEYHLYNVCHETKQVKLSCDAVQILQKFSEIPEDK